MDELDDKVRDALKALEAKATPRDYFDGLEQRIAARLDSPEVSMESEAETHSQSNAVPPRVEDSGLHDIKELARTQKTRISRRQTSQHDIDERMLATSQSGLHQVVALPDPAKMISLPSPEEAKALAQSASLPAVTPIESAPARGKRTPVWLYAGGGLIAAAAAVAIFVGTQNGKAAEPKRAEEAAPERAPRPAPQAAATASGTGAASGSAATVTALPPPPPPQTADEGIATGTGGIVEEPVQPTPADATAKKAAAHEPVKGKEQHADKATEKTDKAAGGGAGSGSGSSSATKTDAKAGDKQKTGGGDKPKDNLDGAVLSEGDKDELGIADVLKGGGGDKDKKPAKTELTSKEIRDGLSAIEGKAKACYDKYQVAGTAKVKLTIAPSGSVSKASATGEFAGTPTGDCVVSAVKGASFPEWDGSPTSTTFVVLLSD